MVEIITANEDNIVETGVVCVRGKKNQEGINRKTEWLINRFKEGMKFKVLKLNGRTQGLIEYMPAELAWRPVDAKGYLFIHCLWVIGKAKGYGYGKMLLDECIKDARHYNGVVVVAGTRPFLTDTKFFIKHGFKAVDKAEPCFKLLVKKTNEAPSPKFRNLPLPAEHLNNEITLLYSDQCPYNAHYINEMGQAARDCGFNFRTVKIETAEQAQNAPTYFGTFNVLYNGFFLTHEIMTYKNFSKLLNLIKK